MNERQWVTGLIEGMQASLNSLVTSGPAITVIDQYRLAYTNEIEGYEGDKPIEFTNADYATDILIRDSSNNGWVPRVIIETKVERVTTHDALTYSSKAATHKQVHPYLRYGILIGGHGSTGLPARLFRHGAYFDFMMTWQSLEPKDIEWKRFMQVLLSEVIASRQIQELLTTSRKRTKKTYHLVHRPLNLE